MTKPHEAIEAGGCAPPIICPHSDKRIMDAAQVEAGNMTTAEYVKIWGKSDA